MIELKLRGRHHTGEWVYSDLYFSQDFPARGLCQFFKDVDDGIIDPDTVGRWTGLKDSTRSEEYPDGVPIYEGDLIEGFSSAVSGFSEWGPNVRGEIIWNDDWACWAVETASIYTPSQVALMDITEQVQVIGTTHIHDGGSGEGE